MKAPNKTRRGRGEGSVHFWGGRWVGQVSQGYSNGKRMRRTVYGATKQEVLDKLSRLRVKQIDGKLPEPSKMTVGEYIEYWLTTAGISESTAASYRRNFHLHIDKTIGHERLQKLTPMHVQLTLSSMKNARTGERIGGRMQRYVRTILNRALGKAVKWGMVATNVCDAVDNPRVVKHEIHPLDQSQATRLIQQAERHMVPEFWILAIETGMRLGELLTLKWQDIDLKHKRLTVRRTESIAGRKLIIKEPKTKQGRRTITLTARCVAKLQSLRRARMAAGLSAVEWVFCLPDGERRHRSVMQKQFKILLQNAELPDIRFHDLRHTHATLLLIAGVNPKVVSERLGHANVVITLDLYSHVLPSLQVDAAEQLSRLLG